MALRWDWFIKTFRVKDNGTGGTPAGSNGQVQFNNNDSFGADSNLFWDNTLKELQTGVVRGSDQSGGNLVLKSTSNATKGKIFFASDSYFDEENKQLFIKGTSAIISPPIRVELEGGASTWENAIWSDTASNAPAVKYERSAGSKASPTAILNNYEIGSFRFFGSYDTSGITSRQLDFGVRAAENWSLTARGTTFFVKGTNTETTGRIDWLSMTDGQLTVPEAYNTTVGGTNRDLYVDDTGLIGYVSSALKYKENIRDISALDIDNIFKLPVKKFDYKDSEKGINQIGIIAEDMEQYFPELCSYKYEYVEETQQDAEGNNILVKIPVLDEQGNHIRELETVQYSKIGLLALLAVKNLDQRLKVLEGV